MPSDLTPTPASHLNPRDGAAGCGNSGQLGAERGGHVGVAEFLLSAGKIGKGRLQVLHGTRSAELLGEAPDDVEGLLVVGGGSRVAEIAGDVPELAKGPGKVTLG
jgi:hypothetical protein